MKCEAEIPVREHPTATKPCSREARLGRRTCWQHAEQERSIPRRNAWKTYQGSVDARRRGESERAEAMRERARALFAQVGESLPE